MNKLIVGDDFVHTFEIYDKYIPEITLEMMSKAGNKVRLEQQKALKNSRSVYYVTRENIDTGEKWLEESISHEYGHREQHNQTASPSNMASFIHSYLMEEKKILVVNGAHRAFYPIIRENGEITGTGRRVGGVSKSTNAILRRMNSGDKNIYYPTRDSLSKISGTKYAQKGVSYAYGEVESYMTKKYLESLNTAEKNNRTKT